MGWYEILNGIRQTLRMAAVKAMIVDPTEGEVEVITPVIRLAGTEAENGVCACTMTTATAAGTVATGARSVSFANSGTADATVAGGSLPAGAAIAWEAPVGAALAAVAYDATGTTLMVAEVR